MKFFSSKIKSSNLTKRLVIAKSIGFLFGLLGFFIAPYVLNNTDLFFRFGILFWYTSLGGILGIFGLIKKHPSFKKLKFPYWFRGIFLGAWMNLVLVLFIFDNINSMIIGTMFEGYSPFWIILEGAIIGLIIEYFSTKFAGEGKKLIK